jgi:hypothetical protein
MLNAGQDLTDISIMYGLIEWTTQAYAKQSDGMQCGGCMYLYLVISNE